MLTPPRPLLVSAYLPSLGMLPRDLSHGPPFPKAKISLHIGNTKAELDPLGAWSC